MTPPSSLRFRRLALVAGPALGLLLALPRTAPAQLPDAATVPGTVTTPYPTIHNLAVEWEIQGDADTDGVVTVQYRPVGEASWRDAMPLRRVPAGRSQGTRPIFEWKNKHSGSLFDLRADTEYEIRLQLGDPDGGDAERIVRVRTRPEPREAGEAGARIIELPAGRHGVLQTEDGTAARPVIYRSCDGRAVYTQVDLRNRK